MKATTLIRGLLIPLIIMAVAISPVPFIVTDVVKGEKLTELVVEIERSLNKRANELQRIVERNQDWYTHDYDIEVAEYMNEWDMEDYTYAEAFKQTPDGLASISPRAPSYEAEFDPLDSSLFNEAIAWYPQGVVEIEWDGNGTITPRTMYTVFRWVPTLDGISDPYLLVVSVSTYSVSTDISSYLYITVWGFSIFLFLSCLFSITMTCRYSIKEHQDKSSFYDKESNFYG